MAHQDRGASPVGQWSSIADMIAVMMGDEDAGNRLVCCQLRQDDVPLRLRILGIDTGVN
jgi:hypothetical protein